VETRIFRGQAEMVVKGGMIAWSVMGDANASIPTPQPVIYGRCSALMGVRCIERHAHFCPRPLWNAAYLQTSTKKKCRRGEPLPRLNKRDMINNDALPRIEVDPILTKCAPTAASNLRKPRNLADGATLFLILNRRALF